MFSAGVTLADVNEYLALIAAGFYLDIDADNNCLITKYIYLDKDEMVCIVAERTNFIDAEAFLRDFAPEEFVDMFEYLERNLK